ncbi:cell division protein ZapB [Nitratidesulfovibrio sp. SRB-5]|uniref:Cell division protein ZapB n=1 Tax=Nitratidesulfovibrio vulgaris (strain DSM 19637 / Miyazaki F) TaxID=883 RepID=B8DKH3_NITV9|nr:cell division protein ZapB [Nitratidesulfovibrio sp. SRB-5]MBZ2172616.1 cell division protein ZapB [Nitratidesulfovibrio sp. SRB-5]RXF77417.1 cell division protein ZapB [Desulfovibrio sp. DS-1]
MELIDLLETRVTALLSQLETLREENSRLREEVEGGLSALAEENRILKEALDEERTVKDAVLTRIDALLLRLKDQTGGA